MSANKNLWLATASALVLFAGAPAFAQQQPNVTVVEPGPAEQAGQAVDNAAGNAADAASNAASEAGQAAQNAANQAGQAADNAADQAGEAAENASQAADNAADQAEDAVETATAEAPEMPVEGQIFQQSPDQYLASTLLDAVVTNPAGDEIGDVNDMIMTKAGEVQGVVIGVGGFLGVGEKNIAIEMSRLQIAQDENNTLNFTLDATSEELGNAPEFMTTEDAETESEANSAAPAGGATPAPATAQ